MDRSSSPFFLVPIPECRSFVTSSSDRSSSPFILEPSDSPTLPPTSVVIRKKVAPRPTLIPPPPSGQLRQRPLRPASRLPVPVIRQVQPPRTVTPPQSALVSQSLMDRRWARQQRERPWASATRSTPIRLTSALARSIISRSAVRSAPHKPLQGADSYRSVNSAKAPAKKVSFAEVKTVKVVSRWINDVPADYSEWRHH
ncbi:uncharacterized protein BHQ10_001233 [Talaromyces amestolkiae]|uniref:Uncharacterized protein n=1 Tax=Talaromyces amestolkiae TaxID=1196081 RepID=A0A364KNZ1_TALAM|nr:uncharacterized protein BHQ10_001233 [Talaromyces amestolkiae]RAO65221.1 hypothetical protein BHQ10_001233 [Talaromyces amestolkiae]